MGVELHELLRRFIPFAWQALCFLSTSWLTHWMNHSSHIKAIIRTWITSLCSRQICSYLTHNLISLLLITVDVIHCASRSLTGGRVTSSVTQHWSHIHYGIASASRFGGNTFYPQLMIMMIDFKMYSHSSQTINMALNESPKDTLRAEVSTLSLCEAKKFFGPFSVIFSFLKL